jgi:hypothetical protein
MRSSYRLNGRHVGRHVALRRKQLAAWAAVKKAVSTKTLVREPCAVCGNPRSQAHHEDYDQPLVVEWLCSLHHGAKRNG